MRITAKSAEDMLDRLGVPLVDRCEPSEGFHFGYELHERAKHELALEARLITDIGDHAFLATVDYATGHATLRYESDATPTVDLWAFRSPPGLLAKLEMVGRSLLENQAPLAVTFEGYDAKLHENLLRHVERYVRQHDVLH